MNDSTSVKMKRYWFITKMSVLVFLAYGCLYYMAKTKGILTWTPDNDNYVVPYMEEEKCLDCRKAHNPPHKVIEMAYMRGGSSLFGQIFNHMNDSIYWYEPLDSFYTHYAATQLWTIPLDLTHLTNGSRRVMHLREEDELALYLYRLMNCKIKEWPAEALVADFAGAMGRQEWMEHYLSCLKDQGLTAANRCSTNLSQFQCTHKNQKTFSNRCPEVIARIKLQPPNATSEDINAIGGEFNVDRTYMHSFVQRQRCLDEKRDRAFNCIHLLQDRCDASEVRAAKVLRAPMYAMRAVLELDPDVLILHTFRDPRAIMLSRRKVGLLSYHIHDQIKEGVLLCKQMMEDIQEAELIEQLHPGTVLRIKYEDLVMNVTATLQQLTAFLNVPYSDSMEEGLMRLMHSQSVLVSSFNQFRANAELTANAWKTAISPALKRAMDEQCAELYDVLGYGL